MPRDDEFEARLLEALMRCLQDLDSGRDPDVREAALGDERLAQRLETILRPSPLVSRLGAESHEVPGSIPRLLGGYELLALLGEGGMGKVFLARDPSLGRLVALKVLKPGLHDDDDQKRRFEREVRVAAGLEHPNIVPVYSHGEDQGLLFYSMRWLTGPDLGSLSEPLSPTEAARVGAHLARALEAAHEQGVIHRDVKPANVLMDGGVPYLVDFGLARRKSDVRWTKEGVLPGTLAFLAPELLRSREGEASPLSDVYSLGATIHQAVHGGPPFDALTAESLVRQILDDPPKPLSLRGRDRELASLIAWAMEKEPCDRSRSAAHFADELERFARGEPIRIRRPPVMVRAWRRVRRRPVLSALLGSLVFGVLLLSIVLGTQRYHRNKEISDRLSAVDNALEDGPLALAESLVADFSRDFGDDAAVLQSQRDRLASMRLVEDWIDAVLERPEDLPPGRLAALASSILESRPRTPLARYVELGLVLHDASEGKAEPALGRLEGIERSSQLGGIGRATAALASVLKGESKVLWPDRSPEHPLEGLFSAQALRLAEAGPDERLAEIARALERDPRSVRAHAAKVHVLLGAHRSAEAISVLETMVLREDLPASWPYFRALAEAGVGHAAESRSALLSVEESSWSPRMWLLRARLDALENRFDEADRCVLKAVSVPPVPLGAALAAGRWWLLRGDLDRAFGLLAEAQKSAVKPVAELACATHLEARLNQALSPTEPSKADLMEILLEARQKVEEVESGTAKSALLTLQARIFSLPQWSATRDPHRIETLARAAVAADPSHPPAQELLLLSTAAVLGSTSQGHASETEERRAAAISAGQSLLRARSAGEWIADPRRQGALLYLAARLAAESGRSDALKALAEAAGALLPDSAAEQSLLQSWISGEAPGR